MATVANYSAGKAHPIVGDGLNMGRPCCGVFRCPELLQSNRHRFCKTHFDEHQKCAIVGCKEPVTSGDATGERSKSTRSSLRLVTRVRSLFAMNLILEQLVSMMGLPILAHRRLLQVTVPLCKHNLVVGELITNRPWCVHVESSSPVPLCLVLKKYLTFWHVNEHPNRQIVITHL